jgi:hypothetical protein
MIAHATLLLDKAIAIMTALHSNLVGVPGRKFGRRQLIRTEMRNRPNAAAINEHNNESIDLSIVYLT